jgi:hypothetical protein
MTHEPILAFRRDFVNSGGTLRRIAGVERAVSSTGGEIL